jgi:hypothetical protein
MRNTYKILVGNLKAREHLGDRRRWEDTTKLDLKETILTFIIWI